VRELFAPNIRSLFRPDALPVLQAVFPGTLAPGFAIPRKLRHWTNGKTANPALGRVRGSARRCVGCRKSRPRPDAACPAATHLFHLFRSFVENISAAFCSGFPGWSLPCSNQAVRNSMFWPKNDARRFDRAGLFFAFVIALFPA
jgi:hypothetical protein